MSLPVIALVGLLCICTACLLGCADQATRPDATSHILDLASEKDTSGFAAEIQKNTLTVRKQLIEHVFKDYLQNKAQSDSTRLANSSHALNWLVSIYQLETKLKDLSDLLRLYESWDVQEVAEKLHLDSVYAVIQAGDSPPVECSSELNALRLNYLQLRDSFYLASIDYVIAGRFHEASVADSCKYYAQRALTVGSSIEYYDLMGDTHLLLATQLSYNESNYERAELEYQNAIKYYTLARSFKRLGYAYMGQGYCRLELDHPFEAIESFRYGNSNCERFGETRLMSYGLNTLAECFIDIGLLDSAYQNATASRDIRRVLAREASEYFGLVAYCESTLGSIMFQSSQYDQALEHYGRADSLFVAADDSDGRALNLLRLGKLYVDQQDILQARENFESALQISHQPETVLECMFGLARCDYQLDNLNAATSRLMHSIALSEHASSRMAVSEIRSDVLATKMEHYHLLASIYRQQYERTGLEAYLDSALRLIEHSRSRALTDALSFPDDPDHPEADSLLAHMSSLYRQRTLNQVDSTSFLRSLRELEDSLRVYQIQDAHRKTERNGSSQRYIRSLTHTGLKDFGAVLGLDEIALEYMFTAYGHFVLALRADSIRAFKFSKKFEAADKMVKEYIQAIRTRPGTHQEDITGLARQVFDLLIPQDLKEFIGARDLLIVPSGRLHLLPFETLKDSDDRFLVATREIRYAPSLTALHLLAKKEKGPPGPRGILVVGDIDYTSDDRISALRYSGSEIRAVTDIVGADRTTDLSGVRATENAFKKLDFSAGDLLHISAHGFADQIRPGRSFIAFAGTDRLDDDAQLHSYEISRMRIPAACVFLSACETASGRVVPGEGVMSLARAFLLAGSNSVVATMWKVDDRFSSRFVENFYLALSQGASVSEALAKAKRSALSSDRKLYRHPYYWSPYVLVGS